jgi:hypothetical protein
MHPDPITGEKRRDAQEKSDDERAFGDDLGHRTAKRDAHYQQGRSRDRREHHDRMSENIFSERTTVAQQTEGEAARDHQNAPP